jgi:hypothetical protein
MLWSSLSSKKKIVEKIMHGLKRKKEGEKETHIKSQVLNRTVKNKLCFAAAPALVSDK